MSRLYRVAVRAYQLVVYSFGITILIVKLFLRQDINICTGSLSRITSRFEYGEGVIIVFTRIVQGYFLFATIIHIQYLMILLRNQTVQIIF